MPTTKLAVVVSAYNEAEVLPAFYDELLSQLKKMAVSYQVIFVNDGSTDKTAEVLAKLKSKGNSQNVRVLSFSRNFGHEAAMLAGIEHSSAESVVCMDADLQHPPNLLPKMIEQYEQGFDIVTMIRTDRHDGGFIKNLFSGVFYKILNTLSSFKVEPNASDFFLISARVAKILKTEYREQTRFLRGIIQIVGFKKTKLPFVAPKRAQGESKYSILKLILFSFTAVSSLSKAPLRIGIYTGLLFAFFSVIVAIYSFVMKFLEQPTAGYTTIVILISAMFSIQFFVLGIMADYIGYVFDEVKRRPHYIIMDDSEEKNGEANK